MNRSNLPWAFCLAVLLHLGCQRQPEPTLGVIGGTLIDGTGATVLPDAVVTIRDSLVLCVGSADRCPLKEGIPTIDASGRWVMPGLIDSHIHWQVWYDDGGELSPEAASRAARVYLANGITTVVDVGGQRWVGPEHMRVLTDLERSGEPAPRMLFSGWIDRRAADESESRDAGRLARELLGSGVDGIKIRDGLLPSEYVAIVTEADRAGRPVYGHTYFLGEGEFVDQTVDAVRAGVDGVFHVLGIPPVASGLEPPLPSVPVEEWEAWWLAGAVRWSFTTDRSMVELIDVMIEHGAWFQPTLVTEQALIEPDHFRNHAGWAYSPMSRETFLAGFPWYEGDELESYRAAYRQMEGFVGRFHESGGLLVAGTDGMPIPGFGLQEELRLLLEAGVPPMAALQSATRNAAMAWRSQDRFGTIEVGKAADLLILDGDPLAEIGNTSRIWRVVRAGIGYDPGALLDQIPPSDLQ